MKKTLFIAISLLASLRGQAQEIWVQGTDRYTVPKSYDISTTDSILFRNTQMFFYSSQGTLRYNYSRVLGMSIDADSSLAITLEEPADKRVIWKPTTSDNQYNNDYYDPNSRWTFKNSKESEHWIVYWDKRFGDNPNSSSLPANMRVDVDDLLEKAEKFFDTNVNKLGMVTEGESQVDNYKMIIHLLYDEGWTAVGSGYDDKIGALWVTPQTCHPVGHTIAHETGHTFQYMVACDHRYNFVGAYTQRGWRYGFGANGSGGNAFWEQCAQWQGFQDYLDQVFGYDVAVWLYNYHRHLNHEWMRYASYWWPFHLVEKHGHKAFGQLWRESKYPEDPIETYIRLFCDNDLEKFWDDYFEYCTKLQNYEFEAVHKYITKNYGARGYSTQLIKNDDDYWQVAYGRCPETAGMNFVPLKSYTQGAEVTVNFKGLEPGSPLLDSDPGKAFKGDPMTTENLNNYTVVKKYNSAGKSADKEWRIAFVAVVQDGASGGSTVVSEAVSTSDECTLTWTVPAKTIRLSLLVVPTPKTYHRHAWDETDINDEQWPYCVKFEGCTINQ